MDNVIQFRQGERGLSEGEREDARRVHADGNSLRCLRNDLSVQAER